MGIMAHNALRIPCIVLIFAAEIRLADKVGIFGGVTFPAFFPDGVRHDDLFIEIDPSFVFVFLRIEMPVVFSYRQTCGIIIGLDAH